METIEEEIFVWSVVNEARVQEKSGDCQKGFALS